MKMEQVKQFEREFYLCHRCERHWAFEDVAATWRCPVCDKRISVYGQSDGIRVSVTRKRAHELVRNDAYLFPRQMTEAGNTVLSVTRNGDSVRVGLDGHGSIKLSANDPVNVRDGGAWRDDLLPSDWDLDDEVEDR